MAIPFANLLLSTKLVVICTGVFSIAVILKQSTPLISDFAVTGLPLIYGSVISWLQPPYLYLVINFIIISIVATSKLQQHRQHPNLEDVSAPSPEILPQPLPEEDVGSLDIPAEYLPVTDQTVQDGRVMEEEEEDARLLEMDGAYYTAVLRPLERSDSGEALIEKEKYISRPPVSARFVQKKSLKASTEGGKALRVWKPKRQDTLESTWRTITDGKAMPLTRHLKKSDTWDSRARAVATSSPVQPPLSKIKKSETFNDHTTTIAGEKDESLPSSSGRLRKEPSLSQDELNRRVEAFIKKFNEEMRLQRQKSLDQYKQMFGVTG
ncbi:hypothetical protein HS088_TW19G00218 [Tripterygium wilfordii]|uniref:DUF4408 domain-containing protein n=1 Tax=Tripterygium wilfordii TaxID=458696 RepID=A0A7J7CA52_TRIWF|nr:uncharacterized protein LOC119985930 [Tripterygium wilfordii]KAF5730626.1 hypothetical protein HS088_TW19G00218 [Tripterygium wilfordii]